MKEITLYRVYKEDTDKNVINNILKTKIIFTDPLNANNYVAVKNRELNNLNYRYFYESEKFEVFENYKEALNAEDKKSEEKTF